MRGGGWKHFKKLISGEVRISGGGVDGRNVLKSKIILQ